MKAVKTFLFIDGTNLFMGLYDLFGARDTPKFKNIIKVIKKNQEIEKLFFYASYMIPRNDSQKEKDLLSAEADFYRQVKETSGLYFYKGHRSLTSRKEKGVDVHLAVDIVKNAFLKTCDQIAVMTGDADLIYPMEIAKNLGIKTMAFFIPSRFSLEMSYKTGRPFVLNFLNKFDAKRGKIPKKLKIIEMKQKAPHASTRGK